MRSLFLMVPLAMLIGHVACAADSGEIPRPETASKEANGMKIRIKIGETTLMATMRDNATARDFVSLLPLTLTLEDYSRTEKISGLPRKLTKEGVPSGSDPSVGDITYYAPWGNLAIFYKDFGYSSGLIIFGEIDSGVEALNVAGPVKATIELAD